MGLTARPPVASPLAPGPGLRSLGRVRTSLTWDPSRGPPHPQRPTSSLALMQPARPPVNWPPRSRASPSAWRPLPVQRRPGLWWPWGLAMLTGNSARPVSRPAGWGGCPQGRRGHRAGPEPGGERSGVWACSGPMGTGVGPAGPGRVTGWEGPRWGQVGPGPGRAQAVRGGTPLLCAGPAPRPGLVHGNFRPRSGPACGPGGCWACSLCPVPAMEGLCPAPAASPNHVSLSAQPCGVRPSPTGG